MQESWISMNEVATYCGVTSETIRNWIKYRDFPAKKIGGRWRFHLSEIDEWAENFSPRKKNSVKALQLFPPDLILGDCLKCMQNIESNSIDLILTDPPYNLGLFMQDREAGIMRMRDNYFGTAGWDNLEYDQWVNSMDQVFNESSRVLRHGGAMIIFMAVIKVETIVRIAQAHGFYYKTTGTWHKLNPMPRNMNLHYVNSTESWIYFIYGGKTGTFNNHGKVMHDFIETSVTPKSERIYGKHPTQKPLELMENFIKTLTNPGDHVLDPFMGSGSTGVAAHKLGRRFTGIELEKKYFEIACKRMGLNND